VSTAILGLTGVIVAGIAALAAALFAARPPSHLADVEGLRVLADELQEERDRLREQLAACQAENTRLRQQRRPWW
jgi:hypothetical protein